jgi:hypothetical protein
VFQDLLFPPPIRSEKVREVGGKTANLGHSRYERAIKYYLGYHIKEAKMYGARAAHRENINMYRILVGKPEERKKKAN